MINNELLTGQSQMSTVHPRKPLSRLVADLAKRCRSRITPTLIYIDGDVVVETLKDVEAIIHSRPADVVGVFDSDIRNNVLRESLLLFPHLHDSSPVRKANGKHSK